MVTIKDVAREAGVAISTVSNVFNNGDIVSEETKQKCQMSVETFYEIGFIVRNIILYIKFFFK